MAGPSSKTRRTPAPPAAMQKSLSRRVSFNEATLTKSGHHPPPPPSDDSDLESRLSAASVAAPRRRRRGCLSLCNSCCAWTSLIIAVLLILLLLLGGVYFAFLQSNLPEVRLQRLDVGKIDVDGDTIVSADFEARLNATNSGDRIELRYGGMTGDVASAGVRLGTVGLPGIRQQPRTTTEIRVRAAVRRLVAEEAAAKELQDNASRRLLVIDVVVKGRIDFYFGGRKMNGLPFKIDCHNIDQSEIDDGHAPRCNIKLTPLR